MFPILGSGLAALGPLMLSRLSVDMPYWQIAIPMVVLGAGLGCVMQVLVLAVVDVLPSIGGTFGTAATFFLAAPIMAVAFRLSFLLHEIQLRTHHDVAHALADDATVPLALTD